MRRTYRSKKDVGGGLDHRDVLLNLDDKSSAFDAFYIQNIKQTKKELSSIGSSTHYAATSNRVRKRKYVKRIIKEAEPLRKESLSNSVFLTPDKSIRVNRGMDPFDMLLNSSPAPEVQSKTDGTDSCEKHILPRRPAVTYTRKKMKKRNYIVNDSTDSEKENSGDLSNTQQNVTDIKSHKLIVEKEPNASPKHGDESINNIVKNLSILHNLKQNSNEFKTPKFNRYRFTKSIQSPILQQSPLCSTPFKEKYRGQSIYKFSPIVASQQGSPNFNVSHTGCNDSVVFVSKNNSSKNILSPAIHDDESLGNGEKDIESKEINNLNKTTDINARRQKKLLTETLGVKYENIEHVMGTVLTDSNLVPANETSSLQTTEIEPFLGFSINEAEDLINKRNKIEALCHTKEINVEEVNEYYFIDSLSIEQPQNTVHSIRNESFNNDRDPGTSSDIDTNDKESLYDTCDSEPFSEENITKEPVVRVEKMSDSLFLKYYELFTDQLQDTKNTEDSETFSGSNRENTFEDNPDRSDFSTDLTDERSSCDTSDVSTSEDATTSHNTASSSSNEEQCISFVTTRRRNEIPKSMVSFFDNSYGSGELEKTVLSDTNSQQKDDFDQSHITEVFNSDEINTINNVTRTSSVKRRRRRYRKSSTNVDNSVNTDSCDETKEATLYALPRKGEYYVDNSVTKQRQSFKRRSTRKSGKREITSPNDSTATGITNVPKNVTGDETISLTVSDYPPISTDANDTMVSNVDTEVSEVTTDHKENIEIAINIASSVSESSDNANEITLYTLPPEKSDNKGESQIEKSSITTRKSSRLSRRSKQSEKEVKYQRSSKSTDNTINNLNKSVARDKPSASNERFSTITTRKPSRVFNESDIHKTLECSKTMGETKPCIVLQPGKKWERSLSIYRRMTMTDSLDHSILDESMQMKGRKYRQSVISTMEMQDMRGSVHNDSINSRRSTFVSKPSRSTISIVKNFNSTRTSLYTTAVFDDLKGFLADDCDDTIVELSKLSIADAEPEVTVLELHETSNRLATARDYVLRRCNQTDAILFDECYPDTVLKNCHKIGEGVYGEVFLWRDRDGRARVMKIVPIAGDIKVNGENQKDFSEIISEIVIAMELSALRAPIPDIERHFEEGNDASALDLHTVENATDVFNEVLAVRCVYGSYPSRLLDLWDLFDECKGSENDNPAILPVDQQYIVLELANAGLDLESYQFNNAEQAYALFYQIAFGLAVGEEAYQFEHRDLHWGNVLIAPTEQKYATFVLRGRAHAVPRRGVAATIIDYSLSRLALPLSTPLSHSDAAALYNDLSTDDGLFDAVGDYQFQVYRLMRDKLGNDWKNFEPYTNILWLHYTVDKMITALRYKRTNTKIHKHYIEKLKGIKNRILDFKSAAEFVLIDNEY